MTRVLLVSEQALFRHALAHILTEAEPHLMVNEASCGREALEQVRVALPDVVLLHIGTPVRTGMQILHDLQEYEPTIPALVLLDAMDDGVMTVAIQAGVAGCLDMSVDVGRLLKAFRDALNGDIALSEGPARSLARMLARGSPGRPRHPGVEMPTPRELDVLRLISVGLTNNEIGRKLLVSESTVRAHVRTLTGKMGARNRSHAVARALALGLISMSTVEQ